ncbi:hypothetical protein HO173_003590 [Letharia columbiana]|uniref:SH3 domain-containing protein n=1 Tax=Letharia columbiana TaxID=112416 RepID=A0A8H6L7G8_9LECA|nr:uncharacterized protein HO173_003590 [Letharia columbiana]KAF6238310.1 hypothetical protein HO173_003590 [Letharia columbiana]
MTRPNIIRADTIDLQNQSAPSAKDHTRQPARPGPLGEGPPAPHQADALKHVEQELSEQHGRSPRASQDLSGKELQLLHEDGDGYGSTDGIGQDSNNLLRNAGANGTAEEDVGDTDGDEGMDDDLMDKISSSPSIGDDGGYHLPLPWPSRVASLRSNSSPPENTPSPKPPLDDFSSSPFSETPTHFPLSFPRKEHDQTPSKDHHQKGGYTKDRETLFAVDKLDAESHDRLRPLISERRDTRFQEDFEDMEDSYEVDFDPNDFNHFLLPANDPLLDNSFDDAPLSPSSAASNASTRSSSPESATSWDDKTTDTKDDDTEDISFLDDPRFIDSGWGGECLRETEDIDFEFVYALHTFVATVEGQANATKGDTMVLLDDSNSYWWLVRVVKDSSIGYLPAEHIETPLERLARLNKHRNLDLASTMLGDEEDKRAGNPLNPLKKAMKRRNAKTVQFTAPSYVEPSDVEYSSDEEEGNREYGAQEQDSTAAQSNDQSHQVDEGVVEPLKPRSQDRDVRQNGDPLVAQSLSSGGIDQGNPPDAARTSDEIFDGDNGTAVTSRKGTVRNTDSFFKDDGVETRKINLTPSLLRDDSNGSVLKSNESKDLKTRASLDSLEKDPPPEKGKEDKKRKEKRGMLGGMFKRRDKKGKTDDKELEDSKKSSNELARQALSPPSRLSPQPKESMESLTQDPQAAKATSPQQRQTGKLQKTPPAKLSPKSSYSQREATNQRPTITEQQNTFTPEPSRAPPAFSEPNGSMRMVQTEPELVPEDRGPALDFNPPVTTREEPMHLGSPRDARRGMFSPVRDEEPVQSGSPRDASRGMFLPGRNEEPFQSGSPRDASRGMFSPVRDEELIQPGSPKDIRRGMFSLVRDEESMQSDSPKDARRGMFSPIKDVLKSAPTDQKPEKVRKAKHRMHMDDFDSSSEDEEAETFSERPSYEEPDSHLAIAQDAQHGNHEPRAPTIPHAEPPREAARERLSESPIEVLPPQEHDRNPQPPQLMVDTSSQEDPSTSPVSPLSSPELIEAPNENAAREETPASTAQSSTPTWSDASLRAYLEDDSDIRDLLVVVHDKSQIKPVGRDHPVVKKLFKEENRKLGEISNRLDGLLGDYLARKQQRTAVR